MMLENYEVSEANWRDATLKQPHFVITETPHGTLGVLWLPSHQIPRWLAGMVSRFRAANLQRFMASLIWMVLSPMLGATFVKFRMSANQPMQLDTGNVTSPTTASSQRPYSGYCEAGWTELSTKTSAMSTQRIKIISNAESDTE